MILLLLILASAALGGVIALLKRSKKEGIAAFLCLFAGANVLSCWPYFGSDSKTWTQTYLSGLMLQGIPLLLVTALPALVACWFTKRIRAEHS